MPVPAMPLPVVGGDDSIEEPKIPEALQELQQLLDPNYVGVGAENLSAALKTLLGLEATHKGALSIPTQNQTTSNVYAALAVADRVSNIVLPTNSLLRVRYWAIWAESVNGIARAAIFVNGTQLVRDGQPAPTTSAEAILSNGSVGDVPSTFVPLGTEETGLASRGSASLPSVTTAEVTTGQAMPAACDIYLPAGTYTVEVRFKAASPGTVSVKNRRLWASVVPA